MQTYEASCCSRKVDPGSNLTTAFGIAVKVVRSDGDCGDHDAEHVQAPSEYISGRTDDLGPKLNLPSNSSNHVMPGIFQSKPKHNEPGDNERRTDRNSHQLILRLQLLLLAGMRESIGEQIV